MNTVLLRSCALLLLWFGMLGVSPVYAAINCTASMSSTAFGNVDPQSTQTDTTATLNYTCQNDGLLAWSARVCFSIGVPTGGGTVGSRFMRKGSDQLGFQLYKDSARSIVWGSQFSGSATQLEVTMTIPGRGVLSNPVVTQSGTATMYGRVVGAQTAVIPGAYTSNYAAVDTALTINDQIGSSAPSSCATAQAGSFPFLVSANVIKKCTVSASPLSFGTNPGLLNAAVNANTSLSVQCSNTTPYHVGLDAGQNGGGNINARKMKLGSNTVSYQLYRDLARTQVWGNTVGTNTVAGTGNGNTQNLNVYGTVPVQTTPPAGTYSDTIVVTVTY